MHRHGKDVTPRQCGVLAAFGLRWKSRTQAIEKLKLMPCDSRPKMTSPRPGRRVSSSQGGQHLAVPGIHVQPGLVTIRSMARQIPLSSMEVLLDKEGHRRTT